MLGLAHKGLAARPKTACSTTSQGVHRKAQTIVCVGDFFKKMQGGSSKKGPEGAGSGKEDAARKALQDSFSGKKYQNFFGQQTKPDSKAQPGGGGGAGFGGPGGSGGGGGGGGGFGQAPEGGDNSGPERPISVELLELLKAGMTVFWNLALFLAFADVLHRSLDWCCQVELLLLVGAPQQAFERVASRFFDMLEWLQKNVLGWDIPGDEDMIPQYENIKLFYPEAHAYTFDQYKYNLTDGEKRTMKNMYALRHYEREGGRPGDVTREQVDAIRAKYDPLTADRKAYQAAKAAGRLEEYWEARKGQYEQMTGERYVRPPGTKAA